MMLTDAFNNFVNVLQNYKNKQKGGRGRKQKESKMQAGQKEG